jgi:hypothetical protein
MSKKHSSTIPPRISNVFFIDSEDKQKDESLKLGRAPRQFTELLYSHAGEILLGRGFPVSDRVVVRPIHWKLYKASQLLYKAKKTLQRLFTYGNNQIQNNHKVLRLCCESNSIPE